MNDNKKENCVTIADVIAIVRAVVKFYERVAEMSEGQLKEAFVFTANNYREIADLIEAAWKREREEVEAARMSTAEKSSAVGNAAAMREALNEIDRVVWDKKRHTKEEVEAHRLATEAMTVPARNCDIYVNAGDAWDAYDEWVESYRNNGEMPPLNEFGWLFNPATESERRKRWKQVICKN